MDDNNIVVLSEIMKRWWRWMCQRWWWWFCGWIVCGEDELDGHKGGQDGGNFTDVRKMLVDITKGKEVHLGHEVRGAHELSEAHEVPTKSSFPMLLNSIQYYLKGAPKKLRWKQKIQRKCFLPSSNKKSTSICWKIVLSICWGKLPALGESVANYCKFFPSLATGEAYAQL